jgi:tRNA (guanine-N7-)-methyltransferase
LRSAFGLIFSLIFAKIFEKSWEAKNKLKGSRKTKHLQCFQPTREEVVGDLFPLKGNGIQISLK